MRYVGEANCHLHSCLVLSLVADRKAGPECGHIFGDIRAKQTIEA